MFRGRRQLLLRDQESGLGFNWRVPVSTAGSFFAALLVVSLVSLGLATAVRVSVGPPDRGEPEQATLAIVPYEGGGSWLERRAVEAGPFPSRWNPAADPEYVARRREALKVANSVGPAYRPRLQVLNWSGSGQEHQAGFEGGVFPPLPDVGELERTVEPREVMLAARILDQNGSRGFTHASLPMNAGELGEVIGARFMLEYDLEGQVLGVVGLKASPEAVMGWLSRGLVTGHEGEAGWLLVEVVAGR